LTCHVTYHLPQLLFPAVGAGKSKCRRLGWGDCAWEGWKLRAAPGAQAATSFFSQLPPSDLARGDSPRAHVAMRLLEAPPPPKPLAARPPKAGVCAPLLRSSNEPKGAPCRPSPPKAGGPRLRRAAQINRDGRQALVALLLSSRSDLAPAAERPLVTLAALLAQRLDPYQSRMRALAEAGQLAEVLGGPVQPTPAGAKLGTCERANVLARRVAEDEEAQLNQARPRGTPLWKPLFACVATYEWPNHFSPVSQPMSGQTTFRLRRSNLWMAASPPSDDRGAARGRRLMCRAGWRSLRGSSRRRWARRARSAPCPRA